MVTQSHPKISAPPKGDDDVQDAMVSLPEAARSSLRKPPDRVAVSCHRSGSKQLPSPLPKEQSAVPRLPKRSLPRPGPPAYKLSLAEARCRVISRCLVDTEVPPWLVPDELSPNDSVCLSSPAYLPKQSRSRCRTPIVARNGYTTLYAPEGVWPWVSHEDAAPQRSLVETSLISSAEAIEI